MYLSVIGFGGQGLVVTCNSLIKQPRFLERMPKVAVRLGKIGLDNEGFVIVGNCFI